MSATRVFHYVNFLPHHTGSGAHLRFYSNAQALIDVGLDLEFVEVSAEPSTHAVPEAFAGCRIRHVPAQPDDPGALGRVAFRLGHPSRAAMRYAFPHHRSMTAVARELMTTYPDALHFIEGEHLASTLPFLPTGRAVWSCHDLLSPVKSAIARAASGLERRPLSTPEKREIRFARRAEQRMARAAPLILTISEADRTSLEGWGFEHVETLTMSIPGIETAIAPLRFSSGGSRLSILHLGATGHLPSYDSLCFLLGEVLPILPEKVRQQLHVRIVGRSDQPGPRSRHIRDLAGEFPQQVELLGFIDDLEPLFTDSDIQVVASTERTGLRTRIVESFAHGLPVAGTTASAAGLLGVRPNENILLADSPADFAALLTDLVSRPEKLCEVSAHARRTYDQLYSRNAVADSLARTLQEHLGIDLAADVNKS